MKRGKGAAGEARRRQRGPCERQGEVRWNAVTVDRGPVLVQVLQGPTGPTKRKERRERRYTPPLQAHQAPKIAAVVVVVVAAATIHYWASCVYGLLAGPINFRRFIMPTRTPAYLRLPRQLAPDFPHQRKQGTRLSQNDRRITPSQLIRFSMLVSRSRKLCVRF